MKHSSIGERICVILKLLLVYSYHIVVNRVCRSRNKKSPSNSKLTIESYNMSEKETLLISKTGVEQIEFLS